MRNAENVRTATAIMNADAIDNVEPRDVSVRFIHEEIVIIQDEIFFPCRRATRPTARDAGATAAPARRTARRMLVSAGFPPRKTLPTLPASSRSLGRCRLSNWMLASNAASSAGVECG